MYTNLTVEENLSFSARYRLPVHYTRAQHVYYVERAIQVCSSVQYFVLHPSRALHLKCHSSTSVYDDMSHKLACVCTVQRFPLV